ncbi:ankyrin repeat domain-containing protein 12 isoform X2 [Parasteatoda tepidariorum]|nr:glutamic acid-rich protein isoform X2 [Parasteatoda tepidariorum]
MSLKVAELKQSLSFRSLRLMEWKDSQNSSLRSFSDSETVISSSRPTTEEFTKSKSKSETNLISPTRNKTEDRSYDILKHSSYFDSFFSKSKKSDIASELKNINTDFRKATSHKSEALIHHDISNNEKLNLQSNVVSPSVLNEKNIVNITTENNSSTNHNTSTMELPNSSPYPVLEGEKNSGSKTELILGEPRCLTLKKNDADPFLTDDPLMFEPDFEDDNRSSNNKPALPKTVERKIDKFIGDMFVDEDEISSTRKKGLSIDREEGELTPEAPHKSSDLNKAKEPSFSETKATLEFFNKINECLRELNDKCREFYSSSTPDYSLAHLQRTMGNVDNIKRKLAFLIKSKNTEKGDKENKKEHRSHSNMRLQSERLAKSSSTVNDNKREHDKQEHSSSLKNDVEELYRQLKENREKRYSENISRHSHRREKRSRDKPSQADLLNRKKISILEKLGTKQEIERVQSLFKRQMNLITQHVIQKKEIDKRHVSNQNETQRRRRRRYHSHSQDELETEKPHDKASLKELKTLEDMEAFLDSLKKDKMLCEQYMNDQKSKGMLKFSSRKEKHVVQDTPVPSIKGSRDSKEAIKQYSNKEVCDTVIQKLNKNFREEDIRPRADEIKTNVTKNTTTAAVVDNLTRHKTDDHFKKAGTISDPNRDSRLKMDLIKSTDQKESESSMNETEKHKKTHHRLDINLKPVDINKEEIKKRERIEPHKSEKAHISAETKENSTRKREDLSDANLRKSENENEEKNSKKQKVTKYLAARRLSDENPTPTDCNTRDVKTIVSNAESLVKDLLSRKVVILDDNGLAMNNEFCIKVINNEVFLKKVSNKRKRKHSGRRALKPQKAKNMKRDSNDQPPHKEKDAKPKPDAKPNSDAKPKPDQERIEPKLDPEPEIDPETIDTTLNEMENFLQDLRSKRKVCDDETRHPIERTTQNKEMKFLARIQAKRKAKLMACVSEGIYSTEKEAKFLKALEKRDDVSESSDVETRKHALLEKIRAEKDAIAEKPKAKPNDDDPLKEVKAFLDMIKEAESVNDENAKHAYVSFSLKRSDVKKLEHLSTASMLTEESQKFLNSVRSKMKAKKAPTSGIGALMRKPEL